MFYCLCCVKKISTDMLEEQLSKESDPDHWRDVAEDGEDKIKIHYLRWYVYTN